MHKIIRRGFEHLQRSNTTGMPVFGGAVKKTAGTTKING
jgi:hypothetical protein